MIKVVQFTKRRSTLTHDEYRAAYVSHYASNVRRLKGIRGHCVNVRSNDSATVQSTLRGLEHGESRGSDTLWDGWEQFHFDSLGDYRTAREGEPDQAGPKGLMSDPGVAMLGGAAEFLFDSKPAPFHVEEIILKPVLRHETKMFKAVQFALWGSNLSAEYTKSLLAGRYANAVRGMGAVSGAVLNVPTSVTVMEAEGINTGGQGRSAFTKSWNSFCELWFQSRDDFEEAFECQHLQDAFGEKSLRSVWYREVDETVNVLPNRLPAPPYYFR